MRDSYQRKMILPVRPHCRIRRTDHGGQGQIRADPVGNDAGASRCYGAHDERDHLRIRKDADRADPVRIGACQSVRHAVEIALHFRSGNAATVGWITKRGNWSITEAGIEALQEFPSAEQLYTELNRRYREIDQRRVQAQRTLNEYQQFIADSLSLVEAGNWTAHEDLAELADVSSAEIIDFLASGKVTIVNGHRVLHADGTIPAEGMINASYRIGDLRRRLQDEGLRFDAADRASQDQRLNVGALRELLDAKHASDTPEPKVARRAWMVRGSNVEGYNLVDDWLGADFVSLSASQLGGLDPGSSYEYLRQQVDAGYGHKSYAYRSQRLEEFDRFLRKMHRDDLVLVAQHGKVYLGVLIGAPYFVESERSLSNLRWEVHWYNQLEPADASQLPSPVPALLQSQAYVVELTEAYQQLAELVPDLRPPESSAAAQLPQPRSLAFSPITDEFAASVFMDRAELGKIADLLWERRQVVFYGPPGTGKTYIARKLANHLTDEGSVKLVQFHPSYTYEDFFEGYRPEPGGSGTLTFTLRPGPFRDFAEAAVANKATPYILIVDEINRANLAKVFGELYFLLEYRDQPISLQYSPDGEFTLPENLFIIGTMNTADRSIARVDAAMRRRFAFVEMHPRVPPVRGLLARWLDREGLPDDAAQLLDELNQRIEDSDAAIGPSYLMRKAIYERVDGLDRVWQHDIMPLLEDLFYGQRDLPERYGLASLRKTISAGTSAASMIGDSAAPLAAESTPRCLPRRDPDRADRAGPTGRARADAGSRSAPFAIRHCHSRPFGIHARYLDRRPCREGRRRTSRRNRDPYRAEAADRAVVVPGGLREPRISVAG
jgi:5-methylcytosine-specific restriction enzyme B